MPLSSRHDDETDQRRPDPHAAEAHQHRGEAATPAKAKAAGGSAQLAPSTAGATTSLAPRVNIVQPHGEFRDSTAPLKIEAFGAPGSTVVVYVTIYREGNVFHDLHVVVPIGPSGEGSCSGTAPIADFERYAIHPRGQNQAGVFSPLRVAEYSGWLGETKGGGVSCGPR